MGEGEADGEGVGEGEGEAEIEGVVDGDTDGVSAPEAKSASRGTEHAASGTTARAAETATPTRRRRPARPVLHALTRGHRSRWS